MVLAPCGTDAAYKRHKKAGEAPCGPCVEAFRAYAREKYARAGEKAREAGRAAYRRRHPEPELRSRACKTCLCLFETRLMDAVYCSDPCRPYLRKNTQVRRDSETPAPKRQRTGRPYLRLRRQVLDEEPSCGICGGGIDPNLLYPHPLSGSLDHIVPLAAGGTALDRDNVRAAHLYCNKSRGAPRRIAA